MPTREELKLLQALPLELKIMRTQQRIREWVNHYGEDGVCVSFSGGKDSTVLLHIARSLYPNIRAVFSDTGLEYPSIRDFVKTIPNVDWVKPEMTFREIVFQYGYPLFGKEVAETIRYARKIVPAIAQSSWGGGATKFFRNGLLGQRRYQKGKSCWNGDSTQTETVVILNGTAEGRKSAGFLDGQADGSRSIFNKPKYLPACQELPFLIGEQCCSKMKKQPMSQYQKANNLHPMVGTTAEESMLRMQGWLRTGCNAFNKGKSQPLSFWLEQDILQYIKQNGLEIASIYGDIVSVDKNKLEYCGSLGDCSKLKCSGGQRTGCAYCAFGLGNEHKKNGKSRFEILGELYPQLYDYCMRGGSGRITHTMTKQHPKLTNLGGRTGTLKRYGHRHRTA